MIFMIFSFQIEVKLILFFSDVNIVNRGCYPKSLAVPPFIARGQCISLVFIFILKTNIVLPLWANRC
nr:MAG TPA: hypothetical protein [Caudoviricetes sp.]